MKIILLASESIASNILFNSLNKKIKIEKVFIENSVGKRSFLKTRLRKVGFIRLIDQLLFIILINNILKFFSKSRIDKLKKQNNLDAKNIPKKLIKKIDSVNSDNSIEEIRNYNVDFIIICGTRIISSKLINSLNARIINIHAGITPQYRGVHGAYWAIISNDIKNAGVTLHYVDKGVDTGKIISQSTIDIKSLDNFSTYPILQLSKGIELLVNFLESHYSNKKLNILKSRNLKESKQWYHPGFLEYLFYYIFYGKK
jgi:folate-dependent phosphoribosylglycinamide formyltransferase PurN